MNPLIHEIFQTTRLLSKELNHALKKHQLFASQWSVLYCVYQHGKMTLTEIWRYLNVEAPTVTRTVNRLEELGWLETGTGLDRREKWVQLSPDAFERMDDIRKSINEFEKQALANLTSEEQELFMKLLRKVDMKGS